MENERKGVGIILLNEEGKVLLLLRNDNPKLADSDMRLEGTWTLPAGKVLDGESVGDAAVRKVFQETGLRASGMDLVSIRVDSNEYAQFRTFGFVANNWEGEILLAATKEHVDARFFDMDALPEKLCEPSVKILNNYKMVKRSGENE